MSKGEIAYLILVAAGFASFMAALLYGWLRTAPWRDAASAAPAAASEPPAPDLRNAA